MKIKEQKITAELIQNNFNIAIAFQVDITEYNNQLWPCGRDHNIQKPIPPKQWEDHTTLQFRNGH